MTLSFSDAPVGAMVWIDIGMGIRHIARKFDFDRVLEFSRKREGWQIVDVTTFSGGKPIGISMKGKFPSQQEMLSNIKKYKDRTYSLIDFNCESGANAAAGNTPKSRQINGAAIGGTIVGFGARAAGFGPIGIIGGMLLGAVIGVAIANEQNDKHPN